MRKVSFLFLLIFLLIFTSACSNSTSTEENSEMENEGITIGQSLNFGDGLFEITVEDADIQNSELTMNVQVVNNSDKEEIVSNLINFSITQNGVDLNSDSNHYKDVNENAFNYTINPNATGDLTLEFTLQDDTNPINIIITPGDETGYNIPGQSQMEITINPADNSVDANETKIEG